MYGACPVSASISITAVRHTIGPCIKLLYSENFTTAYMSRPIYVVFVRDREPAIEMSVVELTIDSSSLDEASRHVNHVHTGSAAATPRIRCERSLSRIWNV